MDIFTALAVPTRRNIIEMLAKKGRLSATDIYEQFKISPPAISQHLKILKQVKLVQVEKQGQLRMYEINLKGMREFEKWSKKMTDLWSKRFDALDEVLANHK
jgi:DNA-binding transcriptional ArsR family regulator